MAENFPWYGVRTRSNFEKIVATALTNKGLETYLPIYRVKKRWSDRVVEKEMPLFAGYVFSRFDRSQRVPVLSSPGVVKIVEFNGEATPIPDAEIEAIQKLLSSGMPIEALDYLREGQRVRVKKPGALENVEGILLKRKSDWKLVISVEILQRSIGIEIDRDWVTPV